jgi:uncharacterized protein YkwD
MLPLLVSALLATGILEAGCGGGTEDNGALDSRLGGGNAKQIREEYAALEATSRDQSTANGVAGRDPVAAAASASAAPASATSASAASAGATSAGPGAGEAEADPVSTAGAGRPADSLKEEALAAVNLARSQERTCGDHSFPAVGSLRWDVRAAHAALLESEWMLASNSFGHIWPGGELVWDRLAMSGYRWDKADENIAAGFRNLPDVMQAWIDSPAHCGALMRADVTDVAIAVVPGVPGGAYLSYWTMVLATPRTDPEISRAPARR